MAGWFLKSFKDRNLVKCLHTENIMMQAYFLRLFDYDFVTNETMITATRDAGAPVKAVQLFAHLLAVNQIWLSRCKNEISATPLQPDWQTASFQSINRENHERWIVFLNAENDFDRVVTYKNFQGNVFTNTITNCITQVINHGTHHRAQVGQQLKLAGTEKLPITDYIYYLRGLES